MTDTNEMLEAAVHYAEAFGWNVMPARTFRDKGGKVVKRPAIPDWTHAATSDTSRFPAWWGKHPDLGMGLLTGRGIIVIDYDGPAHGVDGMASLKAWEKANGCELPETIRCNTPGGGFHDYYATDERVANGVDLLGGNSGIDVRADGGMVVLPPSKYPDGSAYTWAPGRSPDDIPMAEANADVLRLVRGKGPRDETGAEADPDGHRRFEWPEVIAEGARSDTLFKGASSLFAHGLGRDSVSKILHAMNEARCSPPMEAEEVDTIVGSAAKYEQAGLLDDFDELPQVHTFGEIVERDVPQAPEIIEGIVRSGRKVMIAAPSKAGKTMLTIGLALAFVTGSEWLGHRCERGAVLYVDFENDEGDLRERVRDAARAMGYTDADLADRLRIMNLRGCHMTPERFWATITATAGAIPGIVAVIIDPIYKVMNGDENNSETVAQFTIFLDRLVSETGATVVYVHHYSKGAMAYTDPSSRASGSGVFARDADAQLDMARLQVSPTVWADHCNESECRLIDAFLEGYDHDRGTVPLDVRLDSGRYRAWLGSNLDRDELGELLTALDQLGERLHRARAFRVNLTLRGFPDADPINLWYEYPAHVLDTSGLLKLASYETGQTKGAQRGREVVEANKAADHVLINQMIADAWSACASEGLPQTRANVRERMVDYRGEPVTPEQLVGWTRPSRSPWCRFECDQTRGNVLIQRTEWGNGEGAQTVD